VGSLPVVAMFDAVATIVKAAWSTLLPRRLLLVASEAEKSALALRGPTLHVDSNRGLNDQRRSALGRRSRDGQRARRKWNLRRRNGV
jgi:hypothetical protein